MIYRKPDNMKYTDMAIYIDSHIYTDDYDPNLVYQYLYHLSHMLAYKNKYFTKLEDYENFSLYMATYVYLRLMRTDLPKVKSVLNYIKSSLYMSKVQYQQQFYCQIAPLSEVEPEEIDLTYTYADNLYESVDEMAVVELEVYLQETHKVIKEFLKNIPYKRHSTTWYNIYISCLLTFLNSVTISNKIYKMRGGYPITLDDLARYEVENNKDNIILYHLDESMHDYIEVLSKEIKHLMARHMNELLNTKRWIVSSDFDSLMVYADLNMVDDLEVQLEDITKHLIK